ncbi:hypothetical protein AN964_00610 [Heyndrickxia shackletonii]|uniref:Uncharacterized protein n=1 Tax=Heyndrickxia shackletonii TaxID=157838 RepID=A0A0Q3WU63_9BACI|nr:hypothetical protein [Heyndrickxia shackletonii]KQL52188.1 hypothetical protein AN964_00610 [Heyndrickxia shackletonii]NEZ01977.1 hypothetical protein [Heyndrickxia shackletonii]
MRKEDYEHDSSVIIKRSPAVSGRKNLNTLSASSLKCSIVVRSNPPIVKSVSNAIAKNIFTLDKVLRESNEILPWDRQLENR